jgi:hypothetical protein
MTTQSFSAHFSFESHGYNQPGGAFKKADLNQDGSLDKVEFASFQSTLNNKLSSDNPSMNNIDQLLHNKEKTSRGHNRAPFPSFFNNTQSLEITKIQITFKGQPIQDQTYRACICAMFEWFKEQEDKESEDTGFSLLIESLTESNEV